MDLYFVCKKTADSSGFSISDIFLPINLIGSGPGNPDQVPNQNRPDEHPACLNPDTLKSQRKCAGSICSKE
jgi:hypothetical protein